MQLTLDKGSGIVSEARQVCSPNCDERPEGCSLDLIVIHCMALPPGEFGGPWIDQFFCNCLDPNEHHYFEEIHVLKVSSHFLIRRDGHLVQYVPVGQRAWHAGKSNYLGRKDCNDFSVGIELEGDEVTAYTDGQYAVLADLVNKLQTAYPTLAEAPIVGHSDVAPGRKTDPGDVFEWRRLEELLGG